MSARAFQSVILQMKEATDRVVGVVDSEGTIVAASENYLVGDKLNIVPAMLSSASASVVVSGKKTFKPLASLTSGFDYAVFTEGDDEAAKSICVLAAVALNGAKLYYEEKHNRATFIKNIISDNILPEDIFMRAKELRFDTTAPRAVYLIRQQGRADMAAIDVVQKLFPDKQRDFVLSVGDSDIALIKQVEERTDQKELQETAELIEEKLDSEAGVKTVIGIGTVAEQLKELANAYKAAQVAIEVGKVFDTEKTIISYDNLGIGRLIYQLPTTLCEMFLSEVFKKNPINSLDQETLFTINKFFENNLNVSETSRRLFVHRNTLVYRLEKIKKLTGLDLREFDHAIIFKVALMVRKYLDSRNIR